MQNDNYQMDNISRAKLEPTALQFSAEEEPLAVPPTRESGNESEDDEQKYTNESQGLPFKLDTLGDIVLPQMLGCIDLNRQTSENILQEQISLNTSNLIESINDDTFEGLTQNITELSSAAPTESKVEAIEQGIHNLNLSQSSTREKLDNFDDDEDLSAAEMNSRLNPEAKEFVPTLSPPAANEFSNGFGGTAPTAIPPHFKDELISQSPRKGRESDMEDIKIPAENEFEEEIAHKPHGLAGEEAIVEPSENGGALFQEMNWKEAMHGSEKEEGPLVDSPVTEESLEIVDDNQQYVGVSNVCEMSAPVDLDNAGMKQSIYIENNTSQTSTDDMLNHVQVLPDENESEHNSFENINKEEQDVISKEGVQEILTLASEDNIEKKIEEQIEQKMEHLLLSHDKEFTKDVQLETETEQGPINGVEMAPEPTAVSDELILVAEPVSEQPKESSASGIEAHEALALGAAVAAVAAVTTTAAVKKVEAEKNQKNLKKTSSATKSKVPDTKKPAAVPTAKTSTVSSVAAKRTLADKPKPAAASSLATKKATSSTLSAAPRPKTAPASGSSKTLTEKKATTTTTTSTVKSRIDAKPPTTLATRKPLVSSATKTTTSKPAESSSTTTTKSSSVAKTSLGSKPSLGSTKTSSATNSISKPRPATASSAATTNGTANKTAVTSKPTTLAPKSAAPTKPSITSPRGTLTSTLRKTEAVKSPTKTTSSTITSRVSSSNGVTKSTTTTRTTTTKTTSAPSAAARTTTTRLTVTGTSTTGGATTPTSKTNNLVPRKSTPLKKTITNSSTTPTARKSIGSKLNSPATKPTKDTSTPRPVTIPSQHQNNNSKIVEPLVEIALPIDEPKLNGNASPDDVTLPTEAPAAPPNPLEMETA